MRLYPQPGFSAARRRISSRVCAASRGRPYERRSYVQRRRTRSRCQRSSVAGSTKNDCRFRGNSWLSAASKTRSGERRRGRPTWRRSTCSSWRKTRNLHLLRPLRTTQENQQLQQTANDPISEEQTLKQQTSSAHPATLPRRTYADCPSASTTGSAEETAERVCGTHRFVGAERRPLPERPVRVGWTYSIFLQTGQFDIRG
jgi:hypothetical protein